MTRTHWFARFLQRLAQVAGITIALGAVGYPLLHWRFVGTVHPLLGYLAVILGFAAGMVVLAGRSSTKRLMDWLAQMPRLHYLIFLLIGCFVLHFAVLRIIQSLPGEEAPEVYGTWVFFEASAMYPPGDKLVMQAVHFLLGHSHLAVILYVTGMVTFAVWMAYRLGTMAFGEGVGRAAGLALALFPSWLLYGNLEYDLLLGTLLLLLVYLFFRKSPQDHSYGYLVFYGLVLGFTCLVKPIALIFPLPMFIIYLGSKVRFLEAVKRTALIAAFMMVAIAPWTVRNYVVMNRFVLLSTNFGVVLHTANNPEADGREMMMKPLPGEKDEVEMNKRHIREAVTWIAGHPLRFLKLVAYRIGWTWGTDSSFVSCKLYDKVPDWLLNAIRGIVQIVYLALVAVVVVGLLAYKEEVLGSVLGLVLMAPVLYIWALHLVCQAHGQHHLPAIPFMIILGGAALGRYGGFLSGQVRTAMPPDERA